MMKLPSLLVLIMLVSILPIAPLTPVQAMAAEPERKEYFQGQSLCLPGAYLQEPDNCLPMGPSSALTGYARIGLTIPQQPLPVQALPTGLGTVGFQYVLLIDQSVPVYGSLDEAEAKSSRRTISAGKKYLAYRQRIENSKGVFYQFQTGEWIRGESVSSRVGYSSESRGALVKGVPRANFGWTIDPVETLNAPGTAGRPTGHTIPIYTLVYAYETRKVDGYNWVMVGPNEWAEDRIIAKVIYNPNPPEGVTNGRWAEINITEQTVSIYDNSQLVFAALAATGVAKLATRPGLFHVTKKVAAENMTGATEADRSDFYYLESVPWTVYFDEARAIHGIYWRTNFGRPASHGCVNLTIADARWFYDWVKEGDAVWAWSEPAS
jgi:hypothetical protein